MVNKPEQWRLIDSGSLDGPHNMAIDEALLSSFEQGSPPVFRLYGWQPAALSLGRFQNAGDVLDLERCRAARLPVVRRISGGGVIYHADELTYSLVCSPDQIPETASIKDSFRILTGFLLQFYRTLGLDPAYALDVGNSAEKIGQRVPFCFAGRESFDMIVNGKKIGGNAQRRLKRVVFQHGSIPILNRVADGMLYLRQRPAGLDERVTCLAAEGVAADRVFLKSALKAAFCSTLKTSLLEAELTDQEREEAARLMQQKYLNDTWNLNGEGT